MAGKREKCQTTIFLLAFIVLFIASIIACVVRAKRMQKVEYADHMEDVAVTVDGEPYTFRDIAFYLAYGVLYKYIAVSRLNALYLIAGLSVLKSLIRMLTVCIKSTYKRLEFSIYVYITLVLGTYLFSNLKIMMSFNSFIDIIIFYLLAQALFEMMSITYTKINLMRMVR